MSVQGAINQRFNRVEYQMTYFKKFDYSILEIIPSYKKAGKGDNGTYNDCFIMFDTEYSTNLYGQIPANTNTFSQLLGTKRRL